MPFLVQLTDAAVHDLDDRRRTAEHARAAGAALALGVNVVWIDMSDRFIDGRLHCLGSVSLEQGCQQT